MHFLYLLFLAPAALATASGRSNPFPHSLTRRQLRESQACLPGEFSCSDGTGGCCPTGTECTFDARANIPICAGENDACGEEEVYCEEADVCCSAGSTCPTGEGEPCISDSVGVLGVLAEASTVTATVPGTTVTESQARSTIYVTKEAPSEDAGPSSTTAEAVVTWTQIYTGPPSAAAAWRNYTAHIPGVKSLLTDDGPIPTALSHGTLILAPKPGKSISETLTPTTALSYAALSLDSAKSATSSVRQFLPLGSSRPWNTTMTFETSTRVYTGPPRVRWNTTTASGTLMSVYTPPPLVDRTMEIAVAVERTAEPKPEAVPTGAGARVRAEMGVVVGVLLVLAMVM